MEMTELEREFHSDSLEAIRTCGRLGYRPTYWIRMLDEYGGAVNAAKHLMTSGDQWQEGLTRLYEMGRLDLSVEYAVLDPRFDSLFKDEERDFARRRLAAVGVTRS
jgi:hypothetical protein